MKILYIVPNPPSLVRVRPYNLIRGLLARGHEVTVATAWTNDEERGDIERLRASGIPVVSAPLSKAQIVQNLLRAVVTGLPLQATYGESPALRRELIRLQHVPDMPFDVVHVEHLRGACYALSLKSKPGTAPPMVWDSVDCISYLFEQAAARSKRRLSRLITRFELGRTRRYEGRLVSQFERVLVTSAVDRQALENLTPVRNSRRISVLPNGVDLDYFTPGEDSREPATVLFSGKMSYHANVTAALYLVQEIMPLVWRECPEAKVVIAGKDPTPELMALQRSDHRVHLTGTVPDLRPYLRSATMAVSPLLYGAGIQNKVLEAMACGAPVVASAKASAALDVTHGEDLLVAGEAKDFSTKILHLLQHPHVRFKIGVAGRRYVELHHNWQTAAERLEQFYSSLIPHTSL